MKITHCPNTRRASDTLGNIQFAGKGACLCHTHTEGRCGPCPGKTALAPSSLTCAMCHCARPTARPGRDVILLGVDLAFLALSPVATVCLYLDRNVLCAWQEDCVRPTEGSTQQDPKGGRTST